MIRDHRPYWLKRLYLGFQSFYVRRFLSPQFAFLGPNATFMKPWYVEVFGSPVRMGECANVIASADRRVRLSVWSPEKCKGGIDIGQHNISGFFRNIIRERPVHGLAKPFSG